MTIQTIFSAVSNLPQTIMLLMKEKLKFTGIESEFQTSELERQFFLWTRWCNVVVVVVGGGGVVV